MVRVLHGIRHNRLAGRVYLEDAVTGSVIIDQALCRNSSATRESGATMRSLFCRASRVLYTKPWKRRFIAIGPAGRGRIPLLSDLACEIYGGQGYGILALSPHLKSGLRLDH